MCKFVAEAESPDFFMIDGDVDASWKAAPAQLFNRIFWDALSPDMFRHAFAAKLIVNDELNSGPVQLFLMVEREAEAWPRTYYLTAVQESMSPDNLSYCHFGSQRYQQSFSVSNGYCFCPSKRTGANQNCAGFTGRTIQRQISQGVRKVGGTHFSSEHNYIYPASARRDFFGSVVTREGRLESQDFRQHPHLRRSDDTAGRFGGSVSSCGRDDILDGGIRGGGGTTMGEQEDSTAMNSNTAAIPHIYTNIGGGSLSGIRSQQDQSRSHACTRGLFHAVRRIPDEAVVVPCAATLVPVSEDIVSEGVDVCCEESEIGVDMFIVPFLSAGLEIVSELASEDMDVCEESDIVVDIPAVVPRVEPVSI